MKPDFKNTPLTAKEFERLPSVIACGEYWESVYHGESHKIIDVNESWSNPIISDPGSYKIKIIGYIGRKTGIRLAPECGEFLEGVNAKPRKAVKI